MKQLKATLSNRKGVTVVFMIVFLFFGGLFWNLFSSHILDQKDDGLYTGGMTYGDLAWHMTITSNIYAHGLSSTMASDPTFEGTKLSYPFLPDLLTALLMKLGLSMRLAMIWPAYLAIMAFVAVLCYATFRITGSKIGALTVPFLFFFNGTLWAMKYFWLDFRTSGQTLLDFLMSMPKEYAHLGDANIRFSSIICDYVLPQRTFVFGFLVGIIAFYFLWKYWNDKKEKDLLWSALAISALPLIHTHTFLTMGMAAFSLLTGEMFELSIHKKWSLLKTAVKRWFTYFCLPILFLAVPQFLLVYPFDKSSFLRWQFGWMKGQENILAFWAKDLFPYIFVFAIAYFYAPKKLQTFYNAFLAIFAICNLVVFQPHDYDNMKFMIWWFLVSLILTVTLFQTIINKWRWKGGAIVALLFISMALVGGLSVWRESAISWGLLNKEDIALAGYVDQHTDPQAVFLTGSNHNNPIPTLAGRTILTGFEGWLWTHGIDYSGRVREAEDIYTGQKDSSELIKKYHISYILLDDAAKKEYKASKDVLDQSYENIYQTDSYVLYKVRSI